MTSAAHGIPKDTGWAWLVMVCAMMNILVSGGILATYGVLLVSIEEYYLCTTTKSATILGTMTMTRGIAGAVILNTLPKYLSFRAIIMMGSIIFGIALIISSMAPNADFLIFSAGFLSGIGSACLYGPSLVVVGQYFDRYLCFAQMVVYTGSSIGQLVLPSVYLFLVHTYNIRGTYLILGALVLQCVACGAVMRPASFYERRSINGGHVDPRTRLTSKVSNILSTFNVKSKEENREALISEKNSSVGNYYSCPGDELALYNKTGEDDGDDIGFSLLYLARKRDDNVDIDSSSGTDFEHSLQDCQENNDQKLLSPTEEDSGVAEKSIKDILLLLLTNKAMMIILLGIAINSSASRAQWTFFPYRTLELGISKADTALLWAIFGSVMVVSKPIFGLIADNGFVSKQYIIPGCLFIVSATTLCLPLSATFWHMLLFTIVYGIFDGIGGASVSVLLLEEVGIELLPSALSLDVIIRGIFIALGQLFFGWLLDISGGTALGCYIMGGMELVAVMMLMTSAFMKKIQINID